MKITHVLSCLKKGGGERVVVELANIGAQKGNAVTIIAGWQVDPDYLQKNIDPGVTVKFIGQTKNIAYLKIIPWLLKNKKWLCNEDVLHCHLTFGAVFGSIAHILLKNILRKKTPIIVETYHAVGMPIPKFNRWLHSRMMLLRNGVVLMAKDPYWNKFLLQHTHLKTEIIHNGISMLNAQKNIEQKQNFRNEPGIPANCKYLVGTVSMLRPDRQPWLYLPIFQDVYNGLGDEVQFILAGSGIEFDKIKNDIEERGLSTHIHMPGFLSDPVITMSNLDIYVSLSVGAITGISMIEAAMCNVPVVGIQMIENYQAKDDDWVWSHTDSKEVAKKIISLLQNTEERHKLAADQYKYVTRYFTSEAMYISYDSFYRKILAVQ